MSHHAVLRRLEDVARRVRQMRLAMQLAAVWLVGAAVAMLALWVGHNEDRSVGGWLPAIVCASLAVGAICVLRAWRAESDLRQLARRVESAFPDLDASLLTALDQRPSGDGRYGFLQENVLRKAFFHSYKNRWTEIVPTRRLVFAHAANAASAALLVAALVALAMFRPTPSAVEAAVISFDVAKVTRDYRAEIEPGNGEVERGSSLLVLARFKGELPPDATLVYQFDAAEKPPDAGLATAGAAADSDVRQVAMTKSLDDPVFGGRIAAIARPLSYRVVYADKASPAYRVTVFDYPELVRADALLAFPAYTGLEEKLVQDVRRVSAVEGTRLTLTCALNKPVADAELVEVAAQDAQAERIALAPVEGQANAYAATLTLDRSRRLELRLVDADGRANRQKAEFTINALPNRPADLKLIAPAKDVEASPIEELDVRASAWDDFGLARVGVSYAIAGQPPVDVVLGENVPGKQHRPVEHVIAFEQLAAEPDQLLSYFFWAEDIDPQGTPRRTSSDMFFVEVRHFEEIFRQGEQPTDSQMAERQRQQQQQQGGQNAQQAQQLAELQKQVINGTWKIIRRETSLPPSDAFAADVALLIESQNSARQQAETLGERVQDEQSQAHLDAVKKYMEEAAARLTLAKDGPTLDVLPQALSAEQAAYQGLLKLRAREHEVIRANRQQSQQQQQQSQSARNSQDSRAQEQLQQLELREDENRYETQQTANQSQETAEQREDRQVLNRLRELARRQEGLNERIKELQSALEAAETPQQKEEIERQLKRLQDEQQQIVRDAEELQERMERPENQQRMSEERQQLEQARENARQSSEALRERMVTQAAAEGERAERELNELRDQFQERTGGQFAEDVRQMREQARELDDREQALSERLARMDEEQATSRRLDDGDERPQIAEELRGQQERLAELLERMRQTVEEAETAQPLLAEKLYDSIRENRRQDPARALSSAEQSLERGLIDDAQSEEQQARSGISRLREDVDRAAESVLGNDAEVLERALEELQTLNEQLEGELTRESGDAEAPRASREQNERQADERRSREDNAQNGNPQDPERQLQGDRSGEQPDGRQSPRGNNSRDEQQRDQQGEPPQDAGQQRGNRQSGEQPGDQPRGNEQQTEGQRGNRQPGEQQRDEQQRGEQQRGEQQPGRGQRGEEEPNGEPQQGEPRQGEPREGDQANPDTTSQENQAHDSERASSQAAERNRGDRNGPRRQSDDRTAAGGGGLDEFLDRRDDRAMRPAAPIAGEDFLDWSDRLRDVEEMIADPELRAEAARIREQAKDIRKEVKRHSAPPNWDIVRERVAEPLAELQRRVADELLRRSAGEALVPIDRDPVPAEFEEQVRRYYEELGAGE